MEDCRASRPWTSPLSPDAATERITTFLRKVYGRMCLGLAVTVLVAFRVASSPAILRQLVGNQLLFFGLILAELGLVFYLSAQAKRLAAGIATMVFMGYAALNGVSISVVLLTYTRGSR
jgi:FtsH-binding integral membrane protein